MESKIQGKTGACMVQVRLHFLTSHAHVGLFHVKLIYIHILSLPVALHPNTYPLCTAVSILLHPTLIWPCL